MARHPQLIMDAHGLKTLVLSVPEAAPCTPGSMDYRAHVVELLATMLRGHDRTLIAQRCTELTGKRVSRYMLDSYTAPKKVEFNTPAYLMPVLEAVTDSYLYSQWLSEVRGGRFFLGSDAVAAELGWVKRHQEELRKIERELHCQLDRCSHG